MNYLTKEETEKLVKAMQVGRAYRMEKDNTLSPLNNDDILDIVDWAKRIRQLNCQLNLVLCSNLALDIIDGRPTILEDKEVIEHAKESGGKQWDFSTR